MFTIAAWSFMANIADAQIYPADSVIAPGNVMASLESASVFPRSPVQRTTVLFPKQRLVNRLKAAVDSLDDDRVPNLDEQAAKVQREIDSLRSFLQRTSGPDNAAGWADYLLLDEVSQAIDAEKNRVKQIGQNTQEVLDRTTRNTVGLERGPVVRYRRAVRQLYLAARYKDAETTKVLTNRINDLETLLAEIDRVPSPDQTSSIRRTRLLLDETRQAVDLQDVLDGTFHYPNAAVHIGNNFIGSLVNRPVSQLRDVNESILGTRLTGCARLDGNVSVHLLDSHDAARMLIQLDGSLCSNNDGVNGPVRVKTVGSGNVTMARQITLNDHGITVGEIVGGANVSSDIVNIDHWLKLVRKIASKRAAQQKPQA
ncbi:MAG: hypothetical protein AAFP90_04755, partial [Planctomycetota bacterium]